MNMVNSNNELGGGNPICPCGQYFDILSNQCKNKLHYTCGNNISPKHHFLHGRVCRSRNNESLEITSDCNVSLNGTIHSINEDVTYWISVTAGHVSYTAARYKRFHFAPKCSIGVLNSSQVTMKNDFVVAVAIDDEEKSYTSEQY